MNDTTRRFLNAILERLPPGRVVELRLFPAIRQSAMESAAAVIAVELAPPAPADPVPDEQNGASPDDVREGKDEEIDEAVAESDSGAVVASEAAEDSPYREEGTDGGEKESDRPAITRYAVFSAGYRLTLKGSERGKWEVELRHEADAPLDTVERVARGVAKRAGDESDPEHFSGESLRDALQAPAWATTL